MSRAVERTVSIFAGANIRLGMPGPQAVAHAVGLLELLAHHFPGEKIYVSRSRAEEDRERDAEILRRRALGESIRRIAKTLGVSKSTVHRVLASAVPHFDHELGQPGR